MPLPQYSPIKLETLVCYNCGIVMEQRTRTTEEGKVQGVSYVCHRCKYVHEPSLQYSNGQQRPAKPEELLTPKVPDRKV